MSNQAVHCDLCPNCGKGLCAVGHQLKPTAGNKYGPKKRNIIYHCKGISANQAVREKIYGNG